MKFIYQYPELQGPDGDMLDAGPVADVAAAAEAAGWDGFAMTEHPVPGARWLSSGGHQTIDPFIGLANAAAVTSRMILLTYLAVVPYRNPFLLGKAAASVDRVSNGRFVLGVGTGYLKAEYHALGVDFEERNALFDEALDVLPLYWKGEPFSYEGRHFNARDVIARPAPVQQPIPIWIGGNAKLTLRRVAERCQGWMPLIGSPELSATARTAHLDTLEELEGRIREVQDMAGDRAGAIDFVLPYRDPTIAQPTVDVERHREHLRRAEEIGVTWVLVEGPPSSSPAATIEFVEAFAASYVTP